MFKPACNTAILFMALTFVAPFSAHGEAAGPMPYAVRFLGKDAYLPMRLQRLAHPHPLFIMEGADPAHTLRKNSFIGRLPGEPDEAYLNEFAIWWVEGYGGIGMNDNFGGGRTASEEDRQIKGSGPTPFVSKQADKWHNSGTLVLYEAIREAIASHIADYELPFGANKVIAIIATGTFTTNPEGQKEPRIYMVRQDPIRPAHFMRNESAMKLAPDDPIRIRDEKRVAGALKNLRYALPQKPGFKPKSEFEALQRGFREFIEIKARTLAFGYSRGMGHLANSPSNTEFRRIIDFPSFFAFRGYPKAQALSDDGPLGDTRPVLHDILHNFFGDLRETLPEQLKASVPSHEETETLFHKILEDSLNEYFVELTGYPPEFAEHMKAQAGFARLGQLLRQIAAAGNDRVIDINAEDPGKTGTYDLGRILQKMAVVQPNETYAFSLSQALRGEIGDESLRTELAMVYAKVIGSLYGHAGAKEGIALGNLNRYMRLAAEIRNRKIEELFPYGAIWKKKYGPFWDKYDPLMKKFETTLDGKEIWNAIQEDIDNGRRTFRDAEKYTLVLKQRRKDGVKQRQVFDLVTGTTRWIKANSCGEAELKGRSAA